MDVRQECSAMTGGWGDHHPCRNRASYHEQEKWWCKMHAPSQVEARKERSEARYQQAREIYAREQRRVNAELAACAGVPTEVLERISVKELLEIAAEKAGPLLGTMLKDGRP